MTTQQTDALQCAADLEYSIARHGMQDAFTLNAYRAMKMVLTQHARITELESQLAQRFDAAAHGPTSGAADLPEALRVPLDSLHADAGYLCGRLLNGSLTQEQVVESIRRRIDAAKLAAITAQAISAEPAEHVQNPAENEHVAGDVSGNGAGLNMSTPHARITELESQLAQRFEAADVATAAQAVVDRWDTPLWKDVPATAEYIGRLRAALAAGQATAAQAAQPAQPAAESSRFGSPELQAMVIARCVEKDQADSVQEDAAREPLQIFDSPRAKALMRAFEEGWAACRDAEFVGEDAQNDAFNQSATVNVCLAEDWTAAAERASHGQAPAETGNSVSAQTDSAPSRFGSPELQAMIIARCVEKDQADSVQEDAALWRWLAEYLVGPRTDLDDEIVASETVNDLRKLVKAAIKQGEKQ